LLVVNQNFYPGWTVEKGDARVTSYNGLLAIQLPSGSQTVILGYIDDYFLFGLAVTLFTWVAFGFLLYRRNPGHF